MYRITEKSSLTSLGSSSRLGVTQILSHQNVSPHTKSITALRGPDAEGLQLNRVQMPRPHELRDNKYVLAEVTELAVIGIHVWSFVYV